MADKFVFQNAKIKSRENKLLTQQAVQRLSECTTSHDAFKTLIEIGLGAGVAFEGDDFDRLFAYEEEQAVALLKEMNVDNALDAFLLECDYLNAKLVLKSMASGKSATFTKPSGVMDRDDLKTAITAGDLSALPTHMQAAVKQVQKLIFDGKASAHAIDCIMDKAMFAHQLAALPRSEKLAKKYFVTKIDLANFASFVRCKRLGLDWKFFEECFIDGASVSLADFEKLFDAQLDALKESVKYGEYATIVAQLVDSQSLVAFEVASDNMLFSMWRECADDMFCAAPIISHYLARVTQVRVCKLIVAGIKNHVDNKLIRERMRDLYA